MRNLVYCCLLTLLPATLFGQVQVGAKDSAGSGFVTTNSSGLLSSGGTNAVWQATTITNTIIYSFTSTMTSSQIQSVIDRAPRNNTAQMYFRFEPGVYSNLVLTFAGFGGLVYVQGSSFSNSAASTNQGATFVCTDSGGFPIIVRDSHFVIVEGLKIIVDSVARGSCIAIYRTCGIVRSCALFGSNLTHGYGLMLQNAPSVDFFWNVTGTHYASIYDVYGSRVQIYGSYSYGTPPSYGVNNTAAEATWLDYSVIGTTSNSTGSGGHYWLPTGKAGP